MTQLQSQTPLERERDMHSSSHGLLIPGSETRFFSINPQPFVRSYPTQISFFRVRSKVNDTLATESTETSFYDLLGISESGSLPEIKQAYKRLARKYHPDVSPPDRVEEYTKRFIRVQEAYETLSDPRRRSLYDRDLSFSVKRRYPNDVGDIVDRSKWKNRWESQLLELKRRSVNKDEQGNMSWGARMRRQREELSEDS